MVLGAPVSLALSVKSLTFHFPCALVVATGNYSLRCAIHPCFEKQDFFCKVLGTVKRAKNFQEKVMEERLSREEASALAPCTRRTKTTKNIPI